MDAARKALDAPPFPDALQYVYDWTRAVHKRSGVGMSGFLPLTWATADAWSRMTGHVPTHLEIEAMMALDGELLFPRDEEPTDG